MSEFIPIPSEREWTPEEKEEFFAVEKFIDQHGFTCDCCQHVMIDVTASKTGVAQHCVAGDPEGDGSGCAHGMHLEAIQLLENIEELKARLAAAEADAAQAKNGLMVSEEYRHKYAEGKYALYAMGGEFTEAAAKHLPWGSEGPLERYARKVEREHSPLLEKHNSMLVEKLKAAEKERDELRSAAPSWEAIGEKHYDGKPWILRRDDRVTSGFWQSEQGGIQEHRDMNGEYIGQEEIQGWECWWSLDGGFTTDEPPTHAMPFPAPPTGELDLL